MKQMINSKVYLCIDVGGTFLKSALLDSDGHILDAVYTTPAYSDGTKEQVQEGFYDVIRHGIDITQKQQYQLSGIGFAFPGPFDYSNGISLMQHKYASIYDIDLRKYLFGKDNLIPTDTPIHFLHDVGAVLQGEMWRGYAQKYSNTAVVTLGTGIGFSFCIAGEIQRNNLGGPAISVFNLPYNGGILEDYVSRRGLLKLYRDVTGKVPEGMDVEDIGRAADKGDRYCIDIFMTTGKILTQTLYDIIEEQEIECLLFGGQISRSFQHMEKAIKEGLSEIRCLKHISMVENIEYAAFYGILRNIRKQESVIHKNNVSL